MIVSAEDFIKIWQTSLSMDEVVERSGLKRSSASGRASIYRKRGIKLQKFISKLPPGGSKSRDWKKFARLAASVAKVAMDTVKPHKCYRLPPIK